MYEWITSIVVFLVVFDMYVNNVPQDFLWYKKRYLLYLENVQNPDLFKFNNKCKWIEVSKLIEYINEQQHKMEEYLTCYKIYQNSIFDT